MRFYRLDRYESGEGHTGYEFFTAKADADKAARAWMADNSDDEGATAKVDLIEIEPTKAGILRALNRYASHADNG